MRLLQQVLSEFIVNKRTGEISVVTRTMSKYSIFECQQIRDLSNQIQRTKHEIWTYEVEREWKGKCNHENNMNWEDALDR